MKNELLESLKVILVRDLAKLESELLLYAAEDAIWKADKGITNPAGNLVLHLCGNLQHYIGAVLGKSAYIRNRDNEFAAKNISRKELITEIARAKKAVEETLPGLTEQQLQANYPVEVFGKPMTTLYFLIHLTAHFGYHLGQVNYHRRLLA
jgi:uncharacterized damage-inducible protein DinB